jgi:hypothetical protein
LDTETRVTHWKRKRGWGWRRWHGGGGEDDGGLAEGSILELLDDMFLKAGEKFPYLRLREREPY